MKKTFVGIGTGPIQTGIFVSGAVQGGYNRIVLADVDRDMIRAIRREGSITVNTAESDRIATETYNGIEINDPSDKEDRIKLIDAAREATALCTALPSTAFYGHVAPWLKEAFAIEMPRYVYTAENSTTAAKELEKAVGSFPYITYLDTVIGKMSKVFTAAESELPPLASSFNRGHLVEAYNDIYTTDAPGVESVGIVGLHPKANLEPFEAAKLYGHNTCHFLVGLLAHEKGCTYVDEVSRYPEIIAAALDALLRECATALDRKYGAVEPFVKPSGFTPFALCLMARMLNPFLHDSVERIIRDPARKLGWNDRLVGAIRLCRQQKVESASLCRAVVKAGRIFFGDNNMSQALRSLWVDAPPAEVAPVLQLICGEA